MRLSDVVSHSGLSIYAIVALLLFFAVFVAVTVRVARSKRADMDRQARMPLDDSSSPSQESSHG